MSSHYLFENKDPIRLSKRIGHGGEGDVYLIDGKPGVVAKIYHAPLPIHREHKLRNMLVLSSPKLTDISAWPINLIKKKDSENIQGIILPFASGHEMHTIYGPTERKLTLPEATWEFLLFVARNLAIAFDTVHSHKVVIGDVNEKNFMVDQKAIVKIIDCDSFQIPSRNGTPYLCTVGVEHYTPPELQGLDFSKVQRTVNHDCFGLAVLIFQLLFMARHPFAMVAKDSRIANLTFGESIKRFLYAYGRSASFHGISPPPLTVSTNIVPQSILNLFEIAFSHTSVNNRPTASVWSNELDNVLKKVVTCRFDKSHKYCNHLNTCPWCDFAQKTGLYFFVSYGIHSAFDLSTSDISTYRSAFAQLQKFNFVRKQRDAYGIISSSGCKLPISYKLPSPRFYFGLFVLICSALFIVKYPLVIIGVIWSIYLIAKGFPNDKYKEEHGKRKNRFDTCLSTVKSLESKLDDIIKSYDSLFLHERTTISKEIDNYSQIGNEKAKGLKELEANKNQYQLNKYLSRFFIANSKIRDIGNTRSMALISYGIETAADIEYYKISRIPGFGKHLCGILVGWRTTCEKNFRFDAQQQIPSSEIANLEKRINDKKISMQDNIRKGLRTMAELNSKVQSQVTDIENRLYASIKDLKEAEVNLALCK